MEKDSFIFYKSFYDAISATNSDTQLQLYDAICKKALYDEDTELAGTAKTLYILIKPQIEANNKRYRDGQKGGRPKTTGYDEEQTTGLQNKKPNVNENDNENVNENEILGDYETKFNEFYEKYPKKVKKQDVLKWFKKNKPSNELFSSMMNGLEQFRASEDWQKEGGQYIPYPSTWLNQKRWEDEITIKRQKPVAKSYNNYEQRQYEDLSSLYANKFKEEKTYE